MDNPNRNEILDEKNDTVLNLSDEDNSLIGPTVLYHIEESGFGIYILQDENGDDITAEVYVREPKMWKIDWTSSDGLIHLVILPDEYDPPVHVPIKQEFTFHTKLSLHKPFMKLASEKKEMYELQWKDTKKVSVRVFVTTSSNRDLSEDFLYEEDPKWGCIEYHVNETIEFRFDSMTLLPRPEYTGLYN